MAVCFGDKEREANFSKPGYNIVIIEKIEKPLYICNY